MSKRRPSDRDCLAFLSHVAGLGLAAMEEVSIEGIEEIKAKKTRKK